MTTVSLIITTYNRPDTLELVLKSASYQNHTIDQVIVADDGSMLETIRIVNHWRDRLPVTHVWESDNGFRAARIRNLALMKAFGEYVVMIDGDCVMPPNFILNHLSLAKDDTMVAGSRYLYTKEFTASLLQDPESKIRALYQNVKFKTLPLGLLRDCYQKSWDIVRTCNLGLWRKNAIAIGGFDERYIGWGREDSDFVIRLLGSGMRIRSGRYSVCVGHLYHPEQSRDHLAENSHLLSDVIDKKTGSFLAERSVIEL